MGRGRAKAKQTKVARALKYGGPQTDLARLQQELSGAPEGVEEIIEEDIDDPYDPYAHYLDEDEESQAG